ncbi:MAG: HAMP domain-containing protein [Gammaproteobacteria bacterium]|nr:HAMP domain-containing protein [Gammaproteobacteria bacterium]
MKKIRRFFNKSIVTNTLITVGVRIALVITLLTSLSYFHIYSQIATAKLAELQSFAQERGLRESQIFRLAHDNHQLLKQDILNSYQAGVNQTLLTQFEHDFERQPDGAIRVAGDNFDANHTSGMWIAADVELTDDIKHKAVLFSRLVAQYGKSWRNRFTNTYAIGPENFAAVYWPEIPDFSDRISSDFDMRQQEYFAISTQENNPSQQTVWTGIYRDQQADMWMVSVETPIYSQQQHIATIGNDISIDQLFQRTVSDKYQGSYNIIFRDDGRLIVHPHYVEQLKASEGNFYISQDGDSSLKAIYQTVIGRQSEQQLLELDQLDAYLIVTRISGPEWFYIRVIPKAHIADLASSTAAIVFLFGLLALIIELLVLCAVMKRKITWPLLQLTRATMAVTRGYKAQELDGQRPDELGRLARSFNKMSQRLAKRDFELAQSANSLQDKLHQLESSGYCLNGWQNYPS